MAVMLLVIYISVMKMHESCSFSIVKLKELVSPLALGRVATKTHGSLHIGLPHKSSHFW